MLTMHSRETKDVLREIRERLSERYKTHLRALQGANSAVQRAQANGLRRGTLRAIFEIDRELNRED